MDALLAADMPPTFTTSDRKRSDNPAQEAL
jgi:hypothetical protein